MKVEVRLDPQSGLFGVWAGDTNVSVAIVQERKAIEIARTIDEVIRKAVDEEMIARLNPREHVECTFCASEVEGVEARKSCLSNGWTQSKEHGWVCPSCLEKRDAAKPVCVPTAWEVK